MKNLIQAAVVTLFAASAAQAQQAVQWKVSDGGEWALVPSDVEPGGSPALDVRWGEVVRGIARRTSRNVREPG